MNQLVKVLLAVIAISFIFTPTITFAGGYGAIAYSDSARSCGSSYGHRTLQEAIFVAVQRCNHLDCTMKVWFRNACGALAVGNSGAIGWAWAGRRGTAKRGALRQCRMRDSGCRITCWACTGR